MLVMGSAKLSMTTLQDWIADVDHIEARKNTSLVWNTQLRQLLELPACEKVRGLSEKERRDMARKHVGIRQ